MTVQVIGAEYDPGSDGLGSKSGRCYISAILGLGAKRGVRNREDRVSRWNYCTCCGEIAVPPMGIEITMDRESIEATREIIS